MSRVVQLAATSQPDFGSIKMDRALKQRLVGASVLIALAVIVLPMLLGGRPDPGQQTTEKIELPARPDGTAFETRRFPLVEEVAQDPAATEGTVQTLPEPPAADEPAPDHPAADDPAADIPADTLPGSQQADPIGVAGSPEESETAAANVSQQESPDAEGLPPITSVEAPVTDMADLPVEQVPGQSTEPAASGTTARTTGRYAFQVASLGSGANANLLWSKLEAKGFDVISDKIESEVGRLVRVRVGPFNTEEEAAAAVKKIQEQVVGVNPRMVDLDPNAAQSLNPSDPLVRWVVQLGSFGDASNADDLVKQVREQGLSAYSEKVSSSSGATINRVRVGPFLQREEATSAQQSLKSSVGINGVVMSAE